METRPNGGPPTKDELNTDGRPATMMELAKKSITAWIDDYAPSMGAALAYFTLFSLAPLLLLVIAVAGLLFDAEVARGQVVGQLGGLIGPEGSAAIESLLKGANQPAKSFMASTISIVTLVVGATSIFAELQSDLDRIWRAPVAARPAGIWGMLRTRLLSLGLIVSIGFLLLVSLVVSAALAAFGKWYGAWFPGWVITMEIVNQIVSVAFVTAFFAMMYRVLPSVRVTWRDVWQGAFATAVMFTVGKFLIGLYLGKAGVASSFGAAGSIVVLLVWVFYSAQIFLLGAEFTWLYAHNHGSRASEAARQNESAMPVMSPRQLAPVPQRKLLGPARSGARDFATAALVWIGFGALRSLRGRWNRTTTPS